MITRRSVLRTSGALLGASALGLRPLSLLGQDASPLDQMRQTMAAVPLQITKLSDAIHVLSGPGGNITVLAEADGKVAIDSGILPASDAILKAIAGLGPQPLKTLINTHWHFDHTDGNAAFHDAGAVIVAHEGVRKRLSTPQHIQFFGLDFPPSPEGALPSNVFGDGTVIHQGKREIRVTHVPPAHTDTDSFIHFPDSDVIAGGDLLFSGFYPFIDASSGGSMTGMVRGTDQILKMASSRTQIVPGHGPVMTLKDLRAYRDMLATVAERVSTLKKQGKSADEVVAAKPTADFDGRYGSGMVNPDSFVGIVYSTT